MEAVEEAEPVPKRHRTTFKQSKIEAKQQVTIDRLKKEKALLADKGKLERRKLKRLRKSAAAQGERLMELESEFSKKLSALLTKHQEELPSAMIYLRPLIENQLSVLTNKSGRCMWHPSVLEACSAIFSANRVRVCS
jgi:hypothetical protein